MPSLLQSTWKLIADATKIFFIYGLFYALDQPVKSVPNLQPMIPKL